LDVPDANALPVYLEIDRTGFTRIAMTADSFVVAHVVAIRLTFEKLSGR
jgi:hypothetical protein